MATHLVIRVANLCFSYEDHHIDLQNLQTGIHSELNVQDRHVLKRSVKRLSA